MFISGFCLREVKNKLERTYKLNLQSINDEVKKNDKQREI